MNSNILEFMWLASGAYLLGSLPFSLWLGHLFLGKDIRHYGDHNPGAANVFRAGNPFIGTLAVILDIGKGVPFVALSQKVYHLPEAVVLTIGLSAILGNAFSPMLGFKGGKALAVTAGVIIGLLDAKLFLAFFIPALLFTLILESHAWLAILSPLGTLVYLTISRVSAWEILFMLCIMSIFTLKQLEDIHGPPRFKPRFINWLMPGRQS
jgi:glycerol-3-phosphate acyltransferase PlsY